jgi:hypothetical protein
MYFSFLDGSLIYIPPQSVSQSPDGSENEMSTEEALQLKSPKKVPRTWSRNATLSLINLYSQHESKFRSTTIKNDSVWRMIEIEMKKDNFNYTANQCKDKFKYFKIRYTKKIDNMRSDRNSGAAAQKFEFLEEMDAIFAKKPNINPPIIA